MNNPESVRENEIYKILFQGDVPSPSLFVVVMMPLYHVLEAEKADTNSTNHQKKNIQLIYMDDIKIFAKYENELETLIQKIIQ